MEKREIAVNLPNDLDPVYANRIQVAYKDDEFTFVFLHEIPGTNHARAKSIVTISPKHAKNFAEVMMKTIADYETKFGAIAQPVEEKPAAPEENSDPSIIRGYS